MNHGLEVTLVSDWHQSPLSFPSLSPLQLTGGYKASQPTKDWLATLVGHKTLQPDPSKKDNQKKRKFLLRLLKMKP